MLTNLRKDLERYSDGHPQLISKKMMFTSIGFTSVLLFRIQAFFYSRNRVILSYLTHHLNYFITGVDILPGCIIGPGLRIDHPGGIVIGAGVRIGENCTILQGVTLGVKNVEWNQNNHLYPILGDFVTLGAKSSVLGGVTIGYKTSVGAHALVLTSAPEASVLVGIPAKNLSGAT
jgi:serine O-acetyltransferase